MLVKLTSPAPGGLSPGEMVAERYRVMRRLGAGGMGEAYLAEDLLLQRKLALKRLSAATGADPDHARQLITEAKRTTAVQSPHITQVYDVCLHRGDWLLAMEYVSGTDLRLVIEPSRSGEQSGSEKQPLSAERFFKLALQLAEAIEAAHSCGILHCDIKPENIMVTEQDFVKVLDFGLARRLVTPGGADQTISLQGNGSAFAGTPGYIAPEVLREAPPTEQSDIFSLGVVLYEMAGGPSPFKGSSFADSVQLTLAAQPAPLALRALGLPESLRAVIEKALQKAPGHRYGTVRELKLALRACLEPSTSQGAYRDNTLPVPGREPRPPIAKKRSPLRAALTGIAWLCFSGVMMLAGRQIANLASRLRSIHPATVPLSGHDAGHVAGPAPRLLAVMPFRVIGSGSAPGRVTGSASGEDARLNAYNEGLRESITSNLAHAAPSSSIEVLAASEVRVHALHTAEEAHRELGADLVIDGSYQQYGQQARIVFSLVDATGRVLHSDSVTSTLKDPFELQDKVISGVLKMLDVQADSGRSPAQFGTSEPRAYDAYLEGIGYLRDFEISGNLQQALASFKQAIHTDPHFAAAYAGLGEAHWQSYLAHADAEQIPLARENCSRGLALDRQVAEVHICLGTVDAGTGRLADARQQFINARQLDPQSDAALKGLAASYERSGQAEEAEQTYKQAIAARPHYWANDYALADFLIRRSDYAQAASVLESAVRQFPANSFLARKLGVVYFLEGRLDQAAAILKGAIAQSPHGEAYMDLGQVYLHQHKFAPAVASLEQAVSLLPTDFSLQADLGDAYAWSGIDKTRATAAYRRALTLGRDRLQVDPGDPDALMVAAYASSALGQKTEALGYLDHALRYAPQDAEVAYYAARVHARLGDAQQARVWAARAAASGYSSADIATAPDLAAYSPAQASR